MDLNNDNGSTVRALLGLALLAAPVAATPSPSEEVVRRLGVMGTSIDVVVEAATRSEALLASEAGVRAIEAVEARLSTWTEDSELARLNAAAVGEPLRISDALAGDLERVRDAWIWSGGAFDPAVGALVEAWGLRSGGRVPDANEITAALVPGGLAALSVERSGEGSFATRHHAALRLEEGGFGKGVGLDAALAALRDAGATSASFDLGGQVAQYGRTETYGIADPSDRWREVVRVELSHGSFATSGNSERGIEVDGERFGHLLSPTTGLPVADFGSVTAFAADATTADILSTTFYVLGPESALALAAATEGVDALVLDRRGDSPRALATRGLEGRVVLSDDSPFELTWFSGVDR